MVGRRDVLGTYERGADRGTVPATHVVRCLEGFTASIAGHPILPMLIPFLKRRPPCRIEESEGPRVIERSRREKSLMSRYCPLCPRT